jgi:uncharacterized protein YecE (DUF72 family)
MRNVIDGVSEVVTATRLHVGTSGWAYDSWSGVFYPKEVKAAERLVYYAGKFDTVEVNATFYRLPGQTMIGAWNRRLPPDYHLVVKGSRAITHLKKLDDCRAEVDVFWERVRQLRTLRVILWQLPPSLHKNLERLDRFLAVLPKSGVRHAIEFRHASWWDEETAQVLARHEAAFVAVSYPGLPETIRPTTDLLYLRFHGVGQQLYRYDYSRKELSEWAARVRPHVAGRTLYAFFNNTDAGHAPANAATFREVLSRP